MASRSAVAITARQAQLALGLPFEDPEILAAARVIWGLIEGFTRGRGCPVDLAPTSPTPSEAEWAAVRAAATPPVDLGAVALAATLRLAPNPAQHRVEHTTTGGDVRRVEGGFDGFTLVEQLVLNRYRRRVR